MVRKGRHQDVFRLCCPNSDHTILDILPMSIHPVDDLHPGFEKYKAIKIR